MCPCDDCISRRRFLAGAASAAAAAGLSACGDGQIGNPSTSEIPPDGPITITVANFPGLATAGTMVTVGSFRTVMRVGPGEFRAMSRYCTHEQCIVGISGQQLVCPCHGSIFNDDGRVVRGPARRRLLALETSYDPATDQLTIA